MLGRVNYNKFADLPLRLIGAVLTSLVLLIPLFLSPFYLKMWFFILLLLCLLELALNVLKAPATLVVSLTASFFLFWLTDYLGSNGFFLASVFFLFLYFLSRLLMDLEIDTLGVSFWFTFYLIICFISLTSLFFMPQGKMLYLFLLLLVWGGDTAAYFVGMLLGKNKLASQISPHKTWEGVIGGFIFTLLAAWSLSYAFNFNLYFSLGAALIIGFSAPLGDLIESSLKRNFKLKDSGFIFPGHGGALDRLDSLLFSSLIFIIYLWLLGVWH